jgi:magnesium chelatase subunit I
MPPAHERSPRPHTLGALKASGYRRRSLRTELRENLIEHLHRPANDAFSGIIGYDDSVIPELENALLSGHHIVLLGERGQGKTRIIRKLTQFLDELVPVVADCEINDDPFAPVCAACRRRAVEQGDELPIGWLERDRRYGEKLATPDVTIADLIGEIDPIRIAEGRYLADEEAIHFGIIPRTNRGIFAINELPDLTEKVQVGLFNVMEERDLQIKGHKVRLPLDLLVVATANPEDYTSRGRIVTPLKDRFDVQIRTHYPRTLADELAIMEQEVDLGARGALSIHLPDFMREIVARITMEARSAPEVSQSSGVSVRVSINNLETLIASAEKRALRLGENEIAPRITDLPALFASTSGKLELDYGLEQSSESKVVERLIGRAIKATFDAHAGAEGLEQIVDYIGEGWGIAVSDTMTSADYLEGIAAVPGLKEAVDSLGPFESPGLMAAATELLLEGLHLHERLNREREGGRFTYSA